jgi:hypothetical protein
MTPPDMDLHRTQRRFVAVAPCAGGGPRPGLRLAVLAGAGLLAAAMALAATPPKSQSLAQFDAGYAQCEQRNAHMRGQRDQAYAGLWRLKLDDALRQQLAATRSSAAYKDERRRAAQALQKNLSASDVSARLDQQCQALWREAQR